MGYDIATVTKSGGDDAHYKFLAALKTLCEANGWTTLRYNDAIPERELILQSEGLSGTEQIFIGFKCYQSVPLDYYNLMIGNFSGYLEDNLFENQPGAGILCTPAHNNAITYFATANAQNVTFCLKVGTPVYVHSHVGKFFPYARPSEYPAPMVIASMFYGARAPLRFSDTSYCFPYYGRGSSGLIGSSYTSHIYIRNLSGNWESPTVHPFIGNTQAVIGYYTQPADAAGEGSHYQPEPLTVIEYANSMNPNNIWGELESVYMVSGFNNGVENVLQVGGDTVVDQTGLTVKEAVDAIIEENGRAFICLQDVVRTGFNNFIALEMK